MSKFFAKLNLESTAFDARLNWKYVFSANGFSRYGWLGFLLFCLVTPLSIAASQIVVGLLSLYWLITYFLTPTHWSRAQRIKRNWQLVLARPVFCWLLTALLATLVGIDPIHAFPELLKTMFYLLVPFWVSDLLVGEHPSERYVLNRVRMGLLVLLCGQSIAALHTIIQFGLMPLIPISPPGAVTESGQLALSFAAFIGLLFQSPPNNLVRLRDGKVINSHNTIEKGLYFFLAIIFLAVGVLWTDIFQLYQLGKIGISIKAFIWALIFSSFFMLSSQIFIRSKVPILNNIQLKQLVWVAGALMISALLINLKRGPWLGTITQVIIIGCFFSRRLIISALSLTILSALFIEPIRMRIGSLYEHFFIAGGRQTMWSLAIELSERFPLGLGLKNAAFMQTLEPLLPPTHKHMHNNLLNILVETGWLGLSAYIWWSLIAIMLGFICWKRAKRFANIDSANRAMLGFTLATGLIGWQVAGLVEYNFGDGEVRFIAMLYLGMLLALLSVSNTKQSHPKTD